MDPCSIGTLEGRGVLTLMGAGRDTLGPLLDAADLLVPGRGCPCEDEDDPDAMALEDTFTCGAGLPGH